MVFNNSEQFIASGESGGTFWPFGHGGLSDIEYGWLAEEALAAINAAAKHVSIYEAIRADARTDEDFSTYCDALNMPSEKLRTLESRWQKVMQYIDPERLAGIMEVVDQGEQKENYLREMYETANILIEGFGINAENVGQIEVGILEVLMERNNMSDEDRVRNFFTAYDIFEVVREIVAYWPENYNGEYQPQDGTSHPEDLES